MLNFRKLRHEFPMAILKEGRILYEKDMVLSAKIVKLAPEGLRLHCQVLGSFENTYSCDMEIDRRESEAIDSDCDCPYPYDCQHLAAILFYLEENLDRILVEYMQEHELQKHAPKEDSDTASLRKAVIEAQQKELAKRGKRYQQELLHEYLVAARLFAQSPFFVRIEQQQQDHAQLAIIFAEEALHSLKPTGHVDFHLALRLPSRSKPLVVPNLKEFFSALHYHEGLYIGTKRFFFTLESFDEQSRPLIQMIMSHAHLYEGKEEREQRFANLDAETMGNILAYAHEQLLRGFTPTATNEQQKLPMPCLYCGTLEEPLCGALAPALLRFAIEYLEVPAPKLLLKPTVLVDEGQSISLDEALLFDCIKPGVLFQNSYWRFPPQIKRKHLRHLAAIRTMTIPEPLFGTFVENALPELMNCVEVSNIEAIDNFVTLPFAGTVQAECEIQYLNGELEASLDFLYDGIKVPAAHSKVTIDNVLPFITADGIIARDLAKEQEIIDDLFQGFISDPVQGTFVAKAEKKIVEFMTDVVPHNQHRVQFHCPDNLVGHFIYDDTSFKLSLKESSRPDTYELELKANSYLAEITLDQLWDCLTSRRSYIELVPKKATGKRRSAAGKSGEMPYKILVLDLEKLIPVVQLFDELGISALNNHKEVRPLWSLASIDAERFDGLPIAFSISDKLKKVQQEMMSIQEKTETSIPEEINATLRPYQKHGVAWLERLRRMHLGGILADDMGLGKTLQAIIAIVQEKKAHPEGISLVICPTSLLYNWKEEIAKFAPHLRVLVVDGTPQQRRKLLNGINQYDILITSYTLLQKDIETYQQLPFSYAILDEAQQIKNRDTRNAKSVKQIQTSHRLVLTGTPIENSLEDLWSLFDFLMPGLLSSYDRFVEKYIRTGEQKKSLRLSSLASGKKETKELANAETADKQKQQQSGGEEIRECKSIELELLRKKVAPFILRRMKRDVLSDLPPISEIVYHCHLSETQRELYQSYVTTAREELTQLVKKEGFERVQIHVLATVTRLKQICCHPAIFAKDQPERGDSAKYEMLLELVQSLIEGKHKAVIFSQYTRMLGIMRDDFHKMGIRFAYLDGSTTNRLEVVNAFNNDPNVSLFLLSLKAGGTGLNLVGADTVIHYDMWWNPAVEKQATDRVHRLGQEQSVSSYKIVTLNTIEEKIVSIQQTKRGRGEQVLISCDDDAVSKLTWEEVLELLDVNFDKGRTTAPQLPLIEDGVAAVARVPCARKKSW